MPRKWSQSGWLSTGIAFILLASGCFQPAGAGLEATNLAQGLPTFTPFPSDIPTETPIPTLTETPTLEVTVITATPSLDFLISATPIPGAASATSTPIEVAMAQDIEPIWQTATAIYLQQIGIEPGILPTSTTDPGFIDPLLLTATQLVRNATLAVEIPLTQTAAAMFGATPTLTPPPLIIQPTQGAPVVILSGNDCEHQVQTTDRNLYRLGLEYGIHYLDIAYYPLNSIVNPNLIYIGQKIIIPGCGTTGKVPPPTWTPTATSNFPTAMGGAAGYPTFTGNYPTFTGSPIEYTVQAGDTLFYLSLRYGLPIASIVARNPQITNINLIYVGDRIVIG
ncbi:MAG: LysM peptidoglycan-binding domain-containing protein [Chloroflexota bacterium]|nr:LysM peptidoglycan-binding domain-containing protein [Chloroflexota bacterium]